MDYTIDPNRRDRQQGGSQPNPTRQTYQRPYTQYPRNDGYDNDYQDRYHGRYYEEDRRKPTWMIVLFSVVVTLIVVATVYVFFFSDRGMFWDSSDPTKDLAAGTVADPAMPFVGLSLEKPSITVEEGRRELLRAKFQVPAESAVVNTRFLKVKWRSENPSVVYIDSYGMITARSAGTARIVAEIDDPKVDSNPAYCLVTVTPMEVYHYEEEQREPIVAEETPAVADSVQ